MKGSHHGSWNSIIYVIHRTEAEMLFLPAKGFNTNLVQFPPPYHSVRNSPRKLADAEAFAEAYLHFIVFVLAIKMPRQLNSFKFFKKIVFLELKKKFFVKEKKVSFIKKTFLQDKNYSCASIFIIHTFISYILTHYSSALKRYYFLEILLLCIERGY